MDKELHHQQISAFLLCSCLLLLKFFFFFIKWTEKSEKQQIQKFRFTRSEVRFYLFGSCLDRLANLFSNKIYEGNTSVIQLFCFNQD